METTIGRLLYLTHRTVHEELDRRLSQHGASLWNWVLLKEAAHAEGASQRELAQHMGIEPPTLVRQLDKLAEDGLVERRPDPDDRRVVRVDVTPAGLERLQELHAVVHELDAELRGILTKRDVEVLSRALPRINTYFEQRALDDKETKEVSHVRR
jgi:MarR family transcriptional regulator for hemolysin